MLLPNIKKTLHNIVEKKHYYKATKMEFTITTISPEKKGCIVSMANSNPLVGEVFSKTEKERESDVLYMAYGVKEFENREDIARGFLEKKGFGPSNLLLLNEIKALNPPLAERVKDLFVIMAFSPEEVGLVNAIMDGKAQRELTLYLADNDNILEAINFCKEFFMALGNAHSIAQEHKITTEHAFLILAKSVLIERKLMPPDEINKLPDMPQPNVDVDIRG